MTTTPTEPEVDSLVAYDGRGGRVYSLTRRGRVTAFVGHHETVWELTMGALSVVFVVLAFRHDASARSVPAAALIVFSAVFLVAFSVRLWDAPSRTAYARSHWIDVVASIPFVGVLRSIRILRLVRLLPALRSRHGVAWLRSRHGPGSFAFLGPTLAFLWAGSALIIWTLEHDVGRSHIHSYLDALYWSFLISVTIGNTDIKPVTPEGKILGGLLAFLAIGFVGFASSRLTALWLQDEDAETETSLAHRIAALRQQVQRVEVLLAGSGDATRERDGLPDPSRTTKPNDTVPSDAPMSQRLSANARHTPQIPASGHPEQESGPIH